MLPGFSLSQFGVFGSESDTTGLESSSLFVAVAGVEEIGWADWEPDASSDSLETARGGSWSLKLGGSEGTDGKEPSICVVGC